MALGVKYRLDYDDEQLISWRADILQEGFVGSVTAVKMGGTPVMLEMRDIDDPFTPVCHSEATLTLMSESLGQFDEFKIADVFEYVLQLERDSTLFWQGTVLTEPFTEAFESAPFEIELKFSDGISELSYERYDVAGALQSGYTSVIDILVKCFNKLPITRGFREIINLFEDNMNDADTEGLLEQLTIYEPAFWETDMDTIKGEPCLKIIEGICYSLKCRLIVSQDTYYIIRVAETKATTAIKYVDYNSSGVVTGNGTIDLRKSTSTRTEVLPDLLAHLNGATIDINKQYQEVEFIYSSKNITTINNSLLINGNFNGGYELQNGSPVPLYYGRSAAVNTVLGVTPTALHLDTVFIPFEIDTTGEGTDETNANVLVMEDALLTNTRIGDNPTINGSGFLTQVVKAIPAQVTRETYYLFPESPADATVTYKNLLYSTDDHIEIFISGWFDYTYADPSLGNQAMAMMFNKWKIKLGTKYYNSGTQTWNTDADSRVWIRNWGNSGIGNSDEVLEYDGGVKTRRHRFGSSIVLENFDSNSTDDIEITWYIPETLRAPAIIAPFADTISEVEIVFNTMSVKYVSDSSTEFSIQKVLGETGSTSLRTRRYKSEVRHSDGPSNFSIMSFRLPTTNLMTSLWSSRGGSESLPGYEWDINSIIENLGTYRIIFNGDLYGLLELHNIVNLIQETKILLIKGMRFDTRHNVYELKLHEVDSFTIPPIVFVPQFDLSAFTDPTITQPTTEEDPIGATSAGAGIHSQTTGEANTEAQSYTQSTHVQTNNDTSESAGDYPL